MTKELSAAAGSEGGCGGDTKSLDPDLLYSNCTRILRFVFLQIKAF